MKRIFAGLSVSLAFLSAPTAAFAVNVSSNDGSGTQSVSAWYPCGAKTTGTLKSTSGHPVYYGGLTMFGSLIADEKVGRYTSDTSSRTAVSRGGTIGPRTSCAYRAHFTGVKTQVCRNRSRLPDGCGTWATIRR